MPEAKQMQGSTLHEYNGYNKTFVEGHLGPRETVADVLQHVLTFHAQNSEMIAKTALVTLLFGVFSLT